MTEQEKFEAWYKSGWSAKPFEKNANNQYVQVHLQIQWLAWQAAIASREPREWQELSEYEASDLGVFPGDYKVISAALRAKNEVKV